MLLIGLIRGVFVFANWVLGGLPTAELEGLAASFGGVRDFWSVVLQLDAALPIHEMIDAMAVYLVLVIGLTGGATIKKIWSMVPLFGGGV